MGWMRTEFTSEIEVPTDVIETIGEVSRTAKRFQPERWNLHFGWKNETPHYQLTGLRLRNNGQPFLSRERVFMEVPVEEVPAAVRLDLAERMRGNIALFTREEEAKIELVVEGL
jgi:hypothetical protein